MLCFTPSRVPQIPRTVVSVQFRNPRLMSARRVPTRNHVAPTHVLIRGVGDTSARYRSGV